MWMLCQLGPDCSGVLAQGPVAVLMVVVVFAGSWPELLFVTRYSGYLQLPMYVVLVRALPICLGMCSFLVVP